ncbi:phosphoribosyltransferase family protein [Kocuria arenosa]|uniref:phosphoribosyltransferase family protein n=1 Tax=Kocuria arenosa TaxID=3071446 RepID=UPI0034D5C833
MITTTAPVTVVAHRLVGTPSSLTNAVTGTAFDGESYSRMKFGDARALRNLGTDLGKALVSAVPHLVVDDAPPVLPVAYLAVPPACYYLATAVLHVLDAHRAVTGLPSGRITRIHKDSVTRTDYATASAEDRAAELSRIGFTLTDDLTGCHVVVVDDVRVTGLAETAVLGALADSRPRSVTLGYVATVEDPVLRADPSVESAMNHHTIRTVTDMIPAIEEENFHLTIRFLKQALAVDAGDRRRLFDACPTALLSDMLAGARASGTAFVQGYAPGISALERAVRERGPR